MRSKRTVQKLALLTAVCTLFSTNIFGDTFKYGDVNLNGYITTSDAALVMQYVLDNESINLSQAQLKAAKVTNNNVISSVDAASIYSKVLNDEFKFEVELSEETTENSTEESTEETTIGTNLSLNISDIGALSITSSTEFNGITVTPKSSEDTGSDVVIDKSSKTFDNEAYNYRLKLGGVGDITKRSIIFNATGKCALTIIGISSNSSTEREMVLANEDGTIISQKTIGTGISSYTFSVPQSGKYALYSLEGGINLYRINVAYGVNTDSNNPDNSEDQDIPVTGLNLSTIYTAPSAKSTGNGSEQDPMSIYAAIENIAEGGTIYVKGGTYYLPVELNISHTNNGTKEALKSMIAYNNEYVKFDFSGQPYGDTSKNDRGVQLDGSYWHLKGLEFYGAADNGLIVTGSGNIIELCVANANRDTGIQIARRSSSQTEFEQWPANNLILNCTSFDNSDPATGENADGFAAKLTCGNGNIFDGCIAYNNVDDGWDCYTKTSSGAIGSQILRNCISFRNGQTSSGQFTQNSDGNGFKLGGEKISVSHKVENCIAFENKNHGFTDNSNPGPITLIDCTSFNNSLQNGKKSNFDFARDKEKSYNNFKNLISFTENKIASDKYIGSAENCIFYNNKPAYYSIAETMEVNSNNSEAKGTLTNNVKSSDFVSVKAPSIGEDVHKTWRNPDGSININNFLEISTSSKLYTRNLGAKLNK